MMKKDIKLAVFLCIIVIAIVLNFDRLFYATIAFFFLGIIPGTQIAVPSLFVFTVTVVALSTMIVKLLSGYIPPKYKTKIFVEHLFKSKSSV